MGNWFDSIGAGISGAWDWASGGASAGAKATQERVAGSDAAQSGGKATGLTPWMKMLGMTPAEAPPEDRMAKPSELADLNAGLAPAQAGGDRRFSGGVQGNKESNGLVKQADGTYKAPSIQHWDAVGKSGGNRQSDIDARDEDVKVGAPEVYQPDLSKLDRTTTGQLGLQDLGKDHDPQDNIISKGELHPGHKAGKNITGAGAFTSVASGSHHDEFKFEPKTTIDPLTGKGKTTIFGGGDQWGWEGKTGYRAVAHSDDMRHQAQAEAGLVASGGASWNAGLDSEKGLYAAGGIGGKAGAYAQGDANTKTGSVKVGGVDYDAGIGVHGEAFLGAKAGAGGQIGLGPDFIGAKGSAGAFIGAEAAGDIHANLGPVGGKVGGSVMAGAGAGIDGDISYKDGKFHMGGKMFAALGYGGSLGGEVTVDVGAIGKSAYNLASDAGTAISNGASAAGTAIADGAGYVGGAIADGASTAGNAIYNGATAAGDAISSGVDAAGDAISSGASAVGRGVSNAGSAIYNGAANLFSW